MKKVKPFFSVVSFDQSIPNIASSVLASQQPKSAFIFFTAMNKTFSKIALLLIVFANGNPVLASTSQNTALSNQKLDYQTKSQDMIVAGGFLGGLVDTVKDVTRIIDQVDRTTDDIKKRDLQQQQQQQQLEERKAREEERKRRQEELEAARRAATEKQVQEAETRRQYFDSLSTEQKEAYVKQQQAVREKQAAANLLMLGLFADFLIGSGGGSSSGRQTQEEYRYRIENNTPVQTNSPASTKPIDPFYGSCHSNDCPK